MTVIIHLCSTDSQLYQQEFEISDTPAERLREIEKNHFNSIKYQDDRITRIGYALASEHSAKTGRPWYFSGCELPDRLINSVFSHGGPKIPYWRMVPVWDLTSCLAADYYR